jgi:ABC-type transport system involved in multi-copper enzyme maturation permease subunit
VLLATWTLLGVFFAYVIPYALDPEDAPGGLATLLPRELTGTLLSGFPFFGGVFALMLGVLACGSEYGWDTLKTGLVQGPGRLRMLSAKLLALGIVLVPFVLVLFAAGAVASAVVAAVEHAPADWPSAWLLVRALGAGWLMLAPWTALGVLLGIATRGTSLAIGLGILYALVVEGLLSALTDGVDALSWLSDVLLRANGYSLATALGTSVRAVSDNGPGTFSGPFVGAGQATLVLAALGAAFLGGASVLLARRDVR